MTSEILVPDANSGQFNFQLAVYRSAGYRLVASSTTFTAATTTASAKLEFFLTYSTDARQEAMTDFWDTGVPKTSNLRIEVEYTIDGAVRKPRDKYSMVGGSGGGSQVIDKPITKFRGSVGKHKKNVFLNTGRPIKRP